MDYIDLGTTNRKVSRLCFGTLTMAPQQANLSPARGGMLLRHAFEKGINFLDTAQYYENYDHIACALKGWQGQDIVISTKTYAYTRKLAQDALDEARRKLDRDTIDIFMLHEQESIHTLRGHFEALEYFMECRQKGIIRLTGMSTHYVKAVEGAFGFPGIDIIHPILNIEGLGIADGRREDMENALKRAHENGTFIFAMKPFGGGNLFQKAETCLNYVLSLPFVDAVAVGMQSQEEIDANISFFENRIFPPKAKEILRRKKRTLIIGDWCAGCGKCREACSSGALSLQENKMTVDHEKCILCGYCAKRCPEVCIKVI